MERKNKMERILNIILLIGIGLSVGLYTGIHLTQSDVINEIDRWHIAKLYEDGSWQVEYKDGTQVDGCIATGLCQD